MLPPFLPEVSGCVTAQTNQLSQPGTVADHFPVFEAAAAEHSSAVHDLLLRYAADSSAAQLLQPALQRWLSPQHDALAGYVDVGARRVTAALPVTAPAHAVTTLFRYRAAARRSGRRAVFVGVDGERGPVLAAAHGLAALQIGAQPLWRPADWPQILAAHRSLRSAINGARHKLVRVTESSPQAAAQQPAVQACLQAWLATRPLPPLQFVLTAEALGLRHERRIWLAQRAATVEAYLVGWPVAARHGWLFELVRHPQAPAGTSELLIDTAMRAVAASGAQQVSLGLVPLYGHGAGSGQLTPALQTFLQLVRRYGRRYYHFDGLAAFRARLHPHAWQPVWLLSDEPAVSLTTALAVFGALLGPQPGRFLLETLLHKHR